MWIFIGSETAPGRVSEPGFVRPVKADGAVFDITNQPGLDPGGVPGVRAGHRPVDR
jgi:hypothetical protein